MGGGFFFGFFFGFSASGADEFFVDEQLDFEGAVVGFAFDGGDFVGDGFVAEFWLDEFLEAAFGVGELGAGFEGGADVAVPAEDGFFGGGEIAVEVEGADEGFEGVFEAGGAVLAVVLDFAAAHQEAFVESEVAGEIAEETAFGEDGAVFGEGAFAFVGVEGEEFLGEDEVENGVAEEFEALVVGFFFGVVGLVGGVDHAFAQELRVSELVADAILQRLELAREFHGLVTGYWLSVIGARGNGRGLGFLLAEVGGGRQVCGDVL